MLTTVAQLKDLDIKVCIKLIKEKIRIIERETKYEEISQEISEILGAECPHCGSIAIE